MRKPNKEIIGTIVKNGCRFLVYGATLLLPCLSLKDTNNVMYYVGDVKYSDAVGVIMNSRMFSSDKTKAIEVLKKNEDKEFYKSVIQVVNSNMFSSDKLTTIVNMCTEVEES